MFHKKVSEEILRQMDRLKEPVAEEVYDRHQEILEDFSFDRDHMLDYIGFDLQNLADAIAEAKPEKFAQYIIWVRDRLLKKGEELYTIEKNYRILGDILSNEFPEDQYAMIAGYFYAGLRELITV